MAENVPPSKVYSSILYSFVSNKVNESIPGVLKRNSSSLYKSNLSVPEPGPKIKGNLVLYLIVKSLNVFGILGDLSLGTDIKNQRNIRGLIILFSVNAFCVYKVCCVLENCSADNDAINRLLPSICLLVRYFSLVYGTNYAFAKASSVVKCIDRLVRSDYCPPEGKTKIKHCDQQIRKSAYRVSSYINGSLVLVGLLHFTNWLVNVAALSNLEFVEISIKKSVLKWAWNYLQTNLCLSTFLAFCDVSFYCYLFALQFLLQALVVSMSGLLVARISTFKSKLQFSNERLLDRLSVQHTEIYEMTGDVNSVLISHFCVWSLDALLTFFVRFPRFFSSVLLDGQAVDDRVAAMDILIILIGFLVVPLTLSSVADSDCDLFSVCQVRSLTTMDCTSKNQIKGAFLMSKINSASIGFEIARSLKIDKNIVLRTVAVCLAYLLFAVAWLERENQIDDSLYYQEMYNQTKIFITRNK